MQRIEVERVFRHPIDVVFARYCDHEGWSRWAGLGPVRLTREGAFERNGVGATRAFATAPSLREEVIAFDPPRLMEYRIARGGGPIRDHRGAVSFTSEGTGTRVRWGVTFRTPLPLLGWPIARCVGALFALILWRLDRELDREPTAAGSTKASGGRGAPQPAANVADLTCAG